MVKIWKWPLPDPCTDTDSHLAFVCPWRYISCQQAEKLKGQGGVGKAISFCLPTSFPDYLRSIFLSPKNTLVPLLPPLQ